MVNDTGIVQVDLARGSIGLASALMIFNLALVERLLAGLAHIQVDQFLVVASHAVALKLEIAQARAIQCGRMASSSGVCENFTYTSVPPRKSTPHGMWCQNKHGKQARDAKYQ